jgi:hypothetical protein
VTNPADPQDLALFDVPPGTPITYEEYVARLHPEDRELEASE